MKTTNYLLMLLMAGVLALAGCGKSGKPAPTARPPGVVDLGALQQAFPAPTPDILRSLDRLRFATRYRQFDAAFAELDKLAHSPNLTDPQKKAINDVTEQVKQASQAAPPKLPQ